MGWTCSSDIRNKKFIHEFDTGDLLKSNNLEEQSNTILKKQTVRKVEKTMHHAQ
jgi:hypothetical protein